MTASNQQGKPKDLPNAEIIAMAENAVRRSGGRAQVYFKFTCTHCGARCTFSEPGVLYARGECNECGYETKIEKAGFMLVLNMEPPPPKPPEVQPEPEEEEKTCKHGLPIVFMYPCAACKSEAAEPSPTPEEIP